MAVASGPPCKVVLLSPDTCASDFGGDFDGPVDESWADTADAELTT